MIQQESIRAGSLEEQLTAERNNNESLKEIVAELRRHNQFNKLDGSMLECDDLNASVQSLGRNLCGYNFLNNKSFIIVLSTKKLYTYSLSDT